MKKILNSPQTYLEDMIEGIVANGQDIIKRVKGFQVITRQKINKNKVALISGGGSGHEPAHGGFVGLGMLDAAVVGPIFTSPTPNQIEGALKEVTGKKGALLIVKNYTGDRLNFEVAKMLFEINNIPIKTVIVQDDVALPKGAKTAGARGLAGTVFVHKIAGAKAEANGSLKEVARVAQKTADNVKTMGVALSPCIVPALGKPSFTLGEKEIEFGLGIHGEPGIKKAKLTTSKKITKKILQVILQDNFFNNAKVALLINGLGGTPLSELHIVCHDVVQILKSKQITISKVLVGNYVTSLEMKGFSISLLKLDDELEKLLKAKANTLSWKEL